MTRRFAGLALICWGLGSGCAGQRDALRRYYFPDNRETQGPSTTIGVDWNQVPRGVTVPATSPGVDLVIDERVASEEAA